MSDPKWLPALLLSAAAVACGFVVAIDVGYDLHGQVPPEPLGQAFGPACGIIGAVALWGILGVVRNPPTMPWTRRRDRESVRAWEAELAARVAALAADPIGRQYADRVQRGEAWSDEQIAYDQDRTLTVTCPHLTAVEAAMRGRGLYLKRLGPQWVEAQCRVEPWSFAEAWPDPVGYSERYESDRGGARDFLFAEITCQVCPARINVTPPELARDETPWFPQPPKA